MRITKLLIGLLVLLCAACGSKQETPNGMEFEIVTAGTGEVVKEGDILLFNFIFKDPNDSLWWDTYKDIFPQYYIVPDTNGMYREDGMTQMLRMLKAGDSVVVTIPIKKFYQQYFRSAVPPTMDSTWVITSNLKALSVMSRDSFMVYQRDFYTKRQEKIAKQDSVKIEEYLAKNNITAERTASGLRYVITKPGTGKNPETGQIVRVDYLGWTLKGEYFDGSNKAVAMEKGIYNPKREEPSPYPPHGPVAPYEPYEFIIDRPGVIKGWHEALKLMNLGAKATVYIPSKLAYGPQEKSEIIKRDEVLIFDLELVEIKDAPPAPTQEELQKLINKNNKDGKGKNEKKKRNEK